MAFSLPNGSTVAIAATFAAEITITGISNANPAVASATGHGLVEGDIIQVTATSWSKLNNKVYRVGSVTTDTFELEGLDTTNVVTYPPMGAAATRVKEVLTWVQIPQILGVETSGGEQAFYTFQFLESDDELQLPTTKSAISMTLTVADDPAQPFVPLVERYDEIKSIQPVRLSLINGSSIFYPAITTISATPSLTVNELMTRTISVALQARPTRYASPVV